MWQVMIRGNIVMKGYLNNEAATVESFKVRYLCVLILFTQYLDTHRYIYHT